MVKRTTRSATGPREDVVSREYTIHINKRIHHVYVNNIFCTLTILKYNDKYID